MIRPLVVAPMAGGPSTPALVNAATEAGATGFLAAGYKTPHQVEEELRAVHGAYGLNIFVPGPPPPSIDALTEYRALLQPEADRYGIDLPPLRLADDDHFAAKVELAVAYRVPFVSFTFGVPPRAAVAALRTGGSQVLITVTSPAEAAAALAVEPDALIVQGGSAGGHSATSDPASFRGDTPTASLVRRLRADKPLVAAGGVADVEDVEQLLRAGATAVQCGTAFLLADEAGTRPAQRSFMLSERAPDTVVTRAFTGQPARALRNRFTDLYSSAAPIGYPAVHHLTAPLRAAAARHNDADGLNLWAGTGFRSARPAPAADLIARLTPENVAPR
ncbi:oxidoreductase [Paractinoplanes abujensis]|uniref:Propionate 3-nitronate monooxygenase n=1 Tax=Paractinoplanes abujensis TaxID=882441 RepID=A0A7W7FYY6_9ACTN|nr:nitronate monooxygenase [Actinoplanes abujensis]MBB4691508.1 nitronate monooxygenase [Actinoplanes abujensis]GID17075.1 oxidoreductase [Actinoplanes abujensis]